MRFFTFLLSILVSSAAFAQLSDGYYRVKNVNTERYLYLMDNRGTINMSSASADVSAIVPYKGEEKMISDPATVIYVKSISNGYKFSAQGASTTDIIGDNPIKILDRGNGVYWCYASNSGTTLYLADTNTMKFLEYGTLEAISPSTDSDGKMRAWNIFPISSTGSSYFGVKPTFSVNGKHYASFYVDFPFSFASGGMKAYIVTKNNANKAVLEEVTTSVIPAKTPVLIECSSTDPSDNRLEIGGSSSAVSGNLLAGNFFCFDPNPGKVAPHTNLTSYNKSTMRIFGVTSSGKLGLVTPTETYIPANVAYLNTSVAGLASELTLVSDAEYSRVEVAGVSLNKTSLNMNKGASETLVATITPDNATDKTLTWTSSNGNVATVSGGVVTAVGAGNSVITVKTSNGLTATCNVTVTVDVTGVTLDKTTLDLEVGNTATLTATVAPADATDKTITWSSSNAAVAKVENGVVTAVSAGEATITVTTVNGKTATCKVTVKNPYIDVTGVTLDKTTLDLEVGATATLTATVAPANATDKTLTWTTSNGNVATVSGGVVTAVGAGNAVITVKTSNGLTATCNVIVTVDVTGVTLDKTTLDLEVGKTANLTATVAPANATDKTLTWSSSNAAVAKVENGVVTAVSAGEAIITVTTANGKTATCKVTVKNPYIDVTGVTLDKTTLDLEVGATATLIATVAPANATDKTLTWSSSNAAVAKVENGVVTAVSAGEATITVTTVNGKTATCKVTVKNPYIDVTGVTLNTTSLALEVGATATLIATVAPANATDKTLTWSSSNAAVAKVENGVVIAVSAGEAIITVTTVNGKTATCKVTVKNTSIDVAGVTLDKTTLDLEVGATATLTATVAPANATDKTLTWSSSDAAVAKVENGVVTAVSAGEATITVTTVNGKTATCKVTVKNPYIDVTGVTLDKTTLDLEVGATATLIATVAPANATDKTLTWSSSDAAVAKVEDGVVTAVSAGKATITVTTVNGLTAECVVTVEDNSAIEDIYAPAKGKKSAVYTIGGVYVGESVDALRKGIYIKNGKKVLSE